MKTTLPVRIGGAAWVLATLLWPSPAPAANALKEGATCTLSSPVKVKPDSGGASSVLKAGTALTIVMIDGERVIIQAGALSGFAAGKELKKACGKGGGAKAGRAGGEASGAASASASAASSAPQVGQTCTLAKAATLSAKPVAKKGGKVKMAAGTSLTVSEINKGWLTLTSTSKSGFVRAGEMKKVCLLGDALAALPSLPGLPSAIVADATPPPDLPPPPAAESASTPSPEPPTPPAAATLAAAPAPAEAPPPADAGANTTKTQAVATGRHPPLITETPPDDGALATSPNLPMREEKVESSSGLGWVLTSLGVVGLGGAAGAYFLAQGKATTLAADITAYSAQTTRSKSDADSLKSRSAALAQLDLITLASAGVGVVALGVGVIVLASGPASSAQPSTRTEISAASLWLQPLASGIALGGRF